jgi:hypothetical protein
MNPIKRAVLAFALGLTLTVSAGCSDNNFALVGRGTLPASATQTLPDEFVATVERVDAGSREINLRPNDGRARVVGYRHPCDVSRS